MRIEKVLLLLLKEVRELKGRKLGVLHTRKVVTFREISVKRIVKDWGYDHGPGETTFNDRKK